LVNCRETVELGPNSSSNSVRLSRYATYRAAKRANPSQRTGSSAHQSAIIALIPASSLVRDAA
jgi:hypothetical protein